MRPVNHFQVMTSVQHFARTKFNRFANNFHKVLTVKD